MSSLDLTEALGAKGATHPRVSLKDIEESIGAQYYVNLGSAVEKCDMPAVPELSMMTLCVLVMRNGFVIIGKSAPASPENFDPEKGRTFAYEDAVRQIWPLMGFALRQRLFDYQAQVPNAAANPPQ